MYRGCFDSINPKIIHFVIHTIMTVINTIFILLFIFKNFSLLEETLSIKIV